ncbi:MAG: HD domain-containing protein [Burkholderiales bacterium]|nr:HD domain-containing protein [Burkholderiales bacterium]
MSQNPALDRKVVKSVLFDSGERDPRLPFQRQAEWGPPGSPITFLMGDDPRLPTMPARPTLIDFFRLRFSASTVHHLLQSATHALTAGLPEKIVLACLLHDIAVAGFIRGDHGYWGAQLIEPYVDPEVAWAIRYHQALRFFPDAEAGYAYPQTYVGWFGADYKPDAYIEAAYREARAHKWYATARLITIHDIYSQDKEAKVSLDAFVDIIGRNFRQPAEGLGFDASPVAHMWRTMIWPTRFL